MLYTVACQRDQARIELAHEVGCRDSEASPHTVSPQHTLFISHNTTNLQSPCWMNTRFACSLMAQLARSHSPRVSLFVRPIPPSSCFSPLKQRHCGRGLDG